MLGANGGVEVVGTVDSIMLAGATLTTYHEDAHAARAENLIAGKWHSGFYPGSRSGDCANDTAPTFDDRARSS